MSHPVGQRPTLQVFLPRMTFVIPLFRFQGSPCSSSIRRSGRALTPNAFGADRRMIAFAGSGDIPVAESSSGDKNVAPPSYPAIRWRCGRARLRMLSRASRRARRIVVSAGPAACHVSRGPALPFGGQRPPNDRISWERRHSCRRIIIGRQGCRPSQLSGDPLALWWGATPNAFASEPPGAPHRCFGRPSGLPRFTWSGPAFRRSETAE